MSRAGWYSPSECRLRELTVLSLRVRSNIEEMQEELESLEQQMKTYQAKVNREAEERTQ